MFGLCVLIWFPVCVFSFAVVLLCASVCLWCVRPWLEPGCSQLCGWSGLFRVVFVVVVVHERRLLLWCCVCVCVLCGWLCLVMQLFVSVVVWRVSGCV